MNRLKTIVCERLEARRLFAYDVVATFSSVSAAAEFESIDYSSGPAGTVTHVSVGCTSADLTSLAQPLNHIGVSVVDRNTNTTLFAGDAFAFANYVTVSDKLNSAQVHMDIPLNSGDPLNPKHVVVNLSWKATGPVNSDSSKSNSKDKTQDIHTKSTSNIDEAPALAMGTIVIDGKNYTLLPSISASIKRLSLVLSSQNGTPVPLPAPAQVNFATSQLVSSDSVFA